MQKIKNRQGFTIIEVMIVLAIAGLIMLIVFLAVPALERASRNTSRKTDASHLATGVSTFVSNANGELPCESSGIFATTPNDATTVLSDAGTLGQYSFKNGGQCTTSGTLPVNYFSITDANVPSEASTTPADDTVEVYLGATCQGSWATNTGANARQAALIYPIEISGGYQWSCLDAL